MPQIMPPLKWAGGKRWQVPQLRAYWEGHAHRRLVEPFCGGLAVALGLANECVPDDRLEETTLDLARTIVTNSWHTLRADKRLVNEGQQYTLAEGLAFERRTSPGAGPDMAERLKAFGSKS